MIHPVPKPKKELKKKKTKKKKTPEAAIIEKIDLIDSDICLISNRYICILCGGMASFNHHYFHKSNYGALRFEPDNHCPVCFGCHNFTIHTKGDIEQLRDNLIKRIGQDRFGRLKEEGRELANRSMPYLRAELFYKQGMLVEVADANEDVLLLQTAAAKKRLAIARKIEWEKQR